jgi:CheY-like chemotaxis protein
LTRSILVVDDDPIIRDMMVDILESEGYAIRVARNGIEALKLLNGVNGANGEGSKDDEHYLVFLDVMMPGLDGKAVCERLAAVPQARQRHVIFLMSALDKLDEITTCPVDGIIPKPFVVEDVLEVAERYIER